MRIYHDVDAWMELIERKEAHHAKKREARKRIGNILWGIYRDPHKRGLVEYTPTTAHDKTRVGALEVWVEKARGDEHLTHRITHAMRCVFTYTRLITRPIESKKERRARARWEICAMLVRIYKDGKQRDMLRERAERRGERVCARTRNVGRLAPKGGVTYDETKRRGAYTKEDEMIRGLHRWPYRDKCGPAMVALLHHTWDIT